MVCLRIRMVIRENFGKFGNFCVNWWHNKTQRAHQHRYNLCLALVFFALMIDNLLMTVVVPIIPEYIYSHDTDEVIVELRNDFNFDRSLFDDLSSMTWFNHTELSTRQYEHIFNVSFHTNFTDLIDPSPYDHESTKIGWLFASKAIVQLIANPFVGVLVSRIGYSFPMCFGTAVILLSSLLYTFSESYALLFLARAVQGLGSSFTAISGMSMLAEIHCEDKARSRAMGIALGGLALGVIVGYPMGSVMYQFFGKMPPFFVIIVLVVAELVFQLWLLQPQPVLKKVSGTTHLASLVLDPYILLVSGAIFLPEMAMAILESTLPLWLIHTMNPPEWQLGVVFLPDSLGFWLGCNTFGIFALKLGRWLVTATALLFAGVCLICIPLATKIYHLIVPHFMLGLSIGMVDAALMPLLAALVESRHIAIYSNVYAIGQASISLAFAVGPAFGGLLMDVIGFKWLFTSIAIVNLAYVPLCYFLRQTPGKDETQFILDKTSEELEVTTNECYEYKELADE